MFSFGGLWRESLSLLPRYVPECRLVLNRSCPNTPVMSLDQTVSTKASFWTLGRRMMIGTDYSTKFNTRRAQLTLWSRATTCELYGIVVDGFASRDFDQAGGCVEMLFRWRTSSAVDEGCTVDTFTHEIFGATELVLKK
jgi:hypothetical protein